MQRENQRGEHQKSQSNFITRFIGRAIIGLILIFCVNMILEEQQIGAHVGINVVSFVTAGTFGVPGVALLYGIVLVNEVL